MAEAWQRKLHGGGWAGVWWPPEYGGRGATLVEQAIFSEEITRQRLPAPVNVLGLLLAGPTIMVHGTDEQKQRFLEPILSADEIWCQGFSEPGAGSDFANVQTRAVKSDGGWVVTGQKVWTSIAQQSKWCMLVARTDPDAPKHKGLTYFALDMDQEGVEVRPLRQLTGHSEFNELFFQEAFISDENVVGEVNGGWSVAMTTLLNERAGLAFGMQVAMKQNLDELVDNSRACVARRPVRPRPARRALRAHRGASPHGLSRSDDADDTAPRTRGFAAEVDVCRDEPGDQRAGRRHARCRRAHERVAVVVSRDAEPRKLDRRRNDRDLEEHHRRARARTSPDALRSEE